MKIIYFHLDIFADKYKICSANFEEQIVVKFFCPRAKRFYFVQCNKCENLLVRKITTYQHFLVNT